MPDLQPLRIAILTHSPNPRGGVVHALALGDALVRLGHQAVVHAPDPHGRGFCRATLCQTVPVRSAPASPDLAQMVRQRAAEYARYFKPASNRRFDVFHAQDSISGNALADLKTTGLISGFARTVHHLDPFTDPALMALQTRAVGSASRHFTVSQQWRTRLAAQFGIAAQLVGNGVDLAVFTAAAAARDPALRHRLGLKAGPVFLSVGGIEARKNTLHTLHAFRRVYQSHKAAQLVIAGGASLLNHHAYRQEFDAALTASGLPAHAVIITGPLPQQDMPALYRLADALVFPSVHEGFGLVVLEAMASGLPVIVSRIAPFTEYLGEADAAWCDPCRIASIAGAMQAVLNPSRRAVLISRGQNVALRHDWLSTARAHLATYAGMREPQHA